MQTTRRAMAGYQVAGTERAPEVRITTSAYDADKGKLAALEPLTDNERRLFNQGGAQAVIEDRRWRAKEEAAKNAVRDREAMHCRYCQIPVSDPEKIYYQCPGTPKPERERRLVARDFRMVPRPRVEKPEPVVNVSPVMVAPESTVKAEPVATTVPKRKHGQRGPDKKPRKRRGSKT